MQVNGTNPGTNLDTEVDTMSLSDIAAAALQLAQKITFLTGDFEASGILALVKSFIETLNLGSISELISGLLG